jgi:predicted ATPase
MGKLQPQRGQPVDLETAEGCFRPAITGAQGQQAKSDELRATTYLARLLYDRGGGEEAREMLAAIYDWFTEGFDTCDLKEAQALLLGLVQPR